MTLFSAYGDLRDLNTAERAITLALRALDGEQLRVGQLAREYGCTRQTIYRTLNLVSIWVPIDIDEKARCWRLMDDAGT